MFTARARTTASVASDTSDSQVMSIFAVRLSGIVSVGENATTLVIDRSPRRE
jgi:hypothetical protein